MMALGRVNVKIRVKPCPYGCLFFLFKIFFVLRGGGGGVGGRKKNEGFGHSLAGVTSYYNLRSLFICSSFSPRCLDVQVSNIRKAEKRV